MSQVMTQGVHLPAAAAAAAAAAGSAPVAVQLVVCNTPSFERELQRGLQIHCHLLLRRVRGEPHQQSVHGHPQVEQYPRSQLKESMKQLLASGPMRWEGERALQQQLPPPPPQQQMALQMKVEKERWGSRRQT